MTDSMTTHESTLPPSSRRRPVGVVLIGILAPVLVLIGLGAWALSSSVGSAPDDDYHLSSIWCGLGERAGLCESVPGHPDQRVVPKELLDAAACFAFHPKLSGECTTTFHGTAVVSTGNWHQRYYPPLYYAVVGVFASSNVGGSVVAIRVFNALLYVGLTTALWLLLPAARRRALVWTQAATMIPLGAFIVASDNPSSWAVASAATLWLALIGYYEASSRWRRIGFAAVATLGTLLGAGARADAALFCIMAVAIAVIFTIRLTPRYALLSILPACLVLISGFLYLTGAQSHALTAGLPGVPRAPYSPIGMVWANLIDLPSLYAGALGSWSLGWLDTPIPATVWVPMIVICGLAVFLGTQRPQLRKRIALICVGAGLVVYPMVLLIQSHVVVGSQIQPRYVLPLLVVFVGVALYPDAEGRGVSPRFAQLLTAVVLITIANGVALHANMRRYISGIAYVSPDLNHGVQWWWPIGVSPMVSWVIGAAALGGGLALAVVLSTRVTRSRTLAESPAAPEAVAVDA